jgi:hypothetical protein
MKTINLDITQLQRQLQSIDRCDKSIGAIMAGLIYVIFGIVGASTICCIYANCHGGTGSFFQGIPPLGFFIAIGCLAGLAIIGIIDSSLFKRKNRIRIALGMQPYRRSRGIR